MGKRKQNTDEQVKKRNRFLSFIPRRKIPSGCLILLPTGRDPEGLAANDSFHPEIGRTAVQSDSSCLGMIRPVKGTDRRIGIPDILHTR